MPVLESVTMVLPKVKGEALPKLISWRPCRVPRNHYHTRPLKDRTFRVRIRYVWTEDMTSFVVEPSLADMSWDHAGVAWH
jgi:hypothetical protein